MKPRPPVPFRPLRFAALFLAAFAGLAAVFARFDAADRYGRLVVAVAARITPPATGWRIETAADRNPPRWQYRRGGAVLPLRLDPSALGLALLPLISFLLATPAPGPARFAARIAGGVLALLLLDAAVLCAYPVLVSRPGPVTDIAGTFLGLLVFVGAPAILWFALTYPELREVWGLVADGRGRPRQQRKGSRRA